MQYSCIIKKKKKKNNARVLQDFDVCIFLFLPGFNLRTLFLAVSPSAVPTRRPATSLFS